MSELASKSLREFKDLPREELEQRLKDLREELFNLRFRNSMRQLDNALKIRHARRDIARILTLLQELAAVKGGPA